MKILVTGTTGLIGYNLSERLLKDGHEVFGIIHKKNKNIRHQQQKSYVKKKINHTERNDVDGNNDAGTDCAERNQQSTE